MKLLYKPVSLVVSILGGTLAGLIFKRVWKLAAGEVWPGDGGADRAAGTGR
jgi:hypothetical protein